MRQGLTLCRRSQRKVEVLPMISSCGSQRASRDIEQQKGYLFPAETNLIQPDARRFPKRLVSIISQRHCASPVTFTPDLTFTSRYRSISSTPCQSFYNDLGKRRFAYTNIYIYSGEDCRPFAMRNDARSQWLTADEQTFRTRQEEIQSMLANRDTLVGQVSYLQRRLAEEQTAHTQAGLEAELRLAKALPQPSRSGHRPRSSEPTRQRQRSPIYRPRSRAGPAQSHGQVSRASSLSDLPSGPPQGQGLGPILRQGTLPQGVQGGAGSHVQSTSTTVLPPIRQQRQGNDQATLAGSGEEAKGLLAAWTEPRDRAVKASRRRIKT